MLPNSGRAPARTRPQHTFTTCGVAAARRLVGAGAGGEAISMRRSLTLTGLLLALAPVLGLAHAGKARAASLSRRAARVVTVAFAQRGVHYRWAGTSPHTGFDCSGFTRWVYGHVGVSLPHSSYGQAEVGRRVPLRAI